ncbi:MAG: alanine/ornithine racemase family PLP-dependent enzyme [Thiohalocapsa sp.]
MTAPRLEIDLDKLHHNALTLVKSLSDRGISITGITKATLGSPEIANAWLQAGVRGLGDSRIENIGRMRRAHVDASMILVRTPMLSQADQVVALADLSCNTELDVISKLSSAAQKANRTHGILLMVELGDLREGIMPDLLETTLREVLRLPNIAFEGIGTNLACRSGVSPNARNMAELSALADSIDATFGAIVTTVSGGNSANLEWVLSGADTGRINNLRLGESMLLGREPLHRQRINGLHTDAITLVAEVIEAKYKPSKPWGEIAQAAFGEVTPGVDLGGISQTIFAIGRQDTDPSGLDSPPGIEVLAASSDHLVVDAGNYRDRLSVGAELPFQLNYSALLRAMTSPFITKIMSTPTAKVRVESPRYLRA